MDTSDGANDGRRGSVSHKQPVVLPTTAQTQSPSCRTKTQKAENPTHIPASSSFTSTDDSLRTGSPKKAYLHADQQTPKKHVYDQILKPTTRQRGSVDNTPSTAPISSFSRNGGFSDMEIEFKLAEMLEVETGSEDGDYVAAFAKASRHPPITHDSLSELDISRIINNPKLRHDVNFDKELHFRPNLDGSRGRQKLRAADDYWRALISELVLYRLVGTKLQQCTTAQETYYWSCMMRSTQRRMPIMFETIRDILKTLVPERDQAVVAERIDVAMIMQEISKGVFDMMSLANWLATLLKAHCAPMRDEWIDQMVGQVQKSIELTEERYLAFGLRQLLGILEAMKLDVANHQIRHLRAMLIEDGVNFQTKYHLTRIHYGRIDVHKARKWFYREHRLHLSSASSPDKLSVFVSALLKSLLSSSSLSSLPENFSLDSDRLRSFRADLHSLVHTSIISDVLDRLLPNNLAAESRTRAHAALKSSLPSIVPDHRRPYDCAANIAVELVRISSSYTTEPRNFDGVKINFAERLLRNDLAPGSNAFHSRTRQLLSRQLPNLEKLVREHLTLTPLSLHDAMFATAGASPAVLFDRSAQTPTPAAVQQSKNIDAILKRIAHVAVLHWHIWSPIVYDAPAEEGEIMSPMSAYDSEGSSASGSDTESEAGSEVSEVSSAGVSGEAIRPSSPSAKDQDSIDEAPSEEL
ncbi:SOK1-like protein 1 [Elsinoe fawcettii]|nr:SOK1-like protein 1 [Elsinoe fawcettii]